MSSTEVVAPPDNDPSRYALRMLAMLSRQLNRLMAAPVGSDPATINALAPGIHQQLSSRLWSNRNVPEDGGLVSTPPSPDEVLEREALFAQAIAILEDEGSNAALVWYAIGTIGAYMYADYRANEGSTWQRDIDLLDLVEKARSRQTERPIDRAFAGIARFYANACVSLTKCPDRSLGSRRVQAVISAFDTIVVPGLTERAAASLSDGYTSLMFIDDDVGEARDWSGIFTSPAFATMLGALAPSALTRLAINALHGLRNAPEQIAAPLQWLRDGLARARLESSDMTDVSGAYFPQLSHHAGYLSPEVLAELIAGFRDTLGRAEKGTSSRFAVEAAQQLTFIVPSGVPTRPDYIESYLALLEAGYDDEENAATFVRGIVHLLTQSIIDGRSGKVVDHLLAILAEANALEKRAWSRRLVVFNTTAVLLQRPSVDREIVAPLVEAIAAPEAGPIRPTQHRLIESGRLAAVTAALQRRDIEIRLFFPLLEAGAMNENEFIVLSSRLAAALAERVTEGLDEGDGATVADHLQHIARLEEIADPAAIVAAFTQILKSDRLGDSLSADLRHRLEATTKKKAIVSHNREVRSALQKDELRPYGAPAPLSDARTGKLASTLQTGVSWPLEPAYGADWLALSLDEVVENLTLLHRAMSGDRHYENSFSVGFRAARLNSLPCYDGASVLELLLDNVSSSFPPASVAYLLTPSGALPMDGTSPRIHRLNGSPVGLDLGTPEKALAYLRFFCSFVHGEDGPFLIVDTKEDVLDLVRRSGTTDETTIEQIRSTLPDISPPTIEPVLDDQEPPHKNGPILWRTEAFVAYSRAVFRAQFVIRKGGMSEMTEDTILVRDLPFVQPTFRLGQRARWKPLAQGDQGDGSTNK
jgi:hypothetical protein